MWSIVMQPGKKYSTIVEHTFHLSMAALDLDSVKKDNDMHTIYVETEDAPRAILCHLSKASNILQVKLDHVFTQGTDLKFFISGSAPVHMTGYLDYGEPDEELFSDLESEVEEEAEEEESTKKSKIDKGNKRKAEDDVPKKTKSVKLNELKGDSDDDDDDDDDKANSFGYKISDLLDDDESDESICGDEIMDMEDDDDDDDDNEESDDEDEEDDSDEVEDEPVLTKKGKEQQKTPKKQLNGNEQKTPKQDQKTPKDKKTPKGLERTPLAQKTPNANQSLSNGSIESSKKKKNDPKTPLSGLKTKPDTPLPKDKQNQQQKLNGGVVIHDLKVGDGALAKPGKNVKVYYIGRLKSTGKVFDSMQKGPGFSFGLQRGEVIKGWDIGIAGMKVGGKRKVICPPNMAYGAKGSPPEIPPNSTLVFEVELKHVN